MPHPIILILDTSTERGFVALARGEEVAFAQFLPFGLRNSQHLLTTIEVGFQKLSLKPASLDAVAVGVGPGSFTGIRVGLAAAKGIAFPQSIPLISLCSLEGFISSEEGRFASLIDARIGGAYLLIQERHGKSVTPCALPELCSMEKVKEKLAGCRCVVGPFLSRLEKHPGERWIEIPPNPEHLAKVAMNKYLLKEGQKDVQPLYLR